MEELSYNSFVFYGENLTTFTNKYAYDLPFEKITVLNLWLMNSLTQIPLSQASKKKPAVWLKNLMQCHLSSMKFKQTRDRKIKVSCDVKQCCVQHRYSLWKGAYFLPAQWEAVKGFLTLEFTTRSFFETSITIYYSRMCKNAKELLCSQLHPCEKFWTLEKSMIFFPIL